MTRATDPSLLATLYGAGVTVEAAPAYYADDPNESCGFAPTTADGRETARSCTGDVEWSVSWIDTDSGGRGQYCCSACLPGLIREVEPTAVGPMPVVPKSSTWHLPAGYDPALNDILDGAPISIRHKHSGNGLVIANGDVPGGVTPPDSPPGGPTRLRGGR